VYDVAITVEACLRAGTRVDVAWAVETHGFSSQDRSEALAITPGGGRVGSVLSGSADAQLTDLAAIGAIGRLVSLTVSEVDAMVAGLSCGGDARCLLVSATELPAELWGRLRAREPVCLVSHLDGENVTGTTLFTSETIAEAGEQTARLFGGGVSTAVVGEGTVTSVFWAVPKLVVVGAGAIADALLASAGLLGWQVHTTTRAAEATGLIAGLSALDKLVVISHDDDLAGAALQAGLSGPVGYIGALGSRRTQRSRADWLAYRGVIDLDRINGPAGLDIGATTPAEIAVSIVAEALAQRAGAAGTPLRRRDGSIHAG
jgi:xanthine dehydrogenase accessory factor